MTLWRTMGVWSFPVAAFVCELEAARHLEVQLEGGALPLPPHGVLYVDVYLWL